MNSKQRFKLSPELQSQVFPRIIGISIVDAKTIIGLLEIMCNSRHTHELTREMITEIIDAVKEELQKHGE